MIWDVGLGGLHAPLRGTLADRLRGWVDLLREIRNHGGVIRSTEGIDLDDAWSVIAEAHSAPQFERLRLELEDHLHAVRSFAKFWARPSGPTVDIRVVEGEPSFGPEEWRVPIVDAGRESGHKRRAWEGDTVLCLQRCFRCSRVDIGDESAPHRIVIYDPNFANVLLYKPRGARNAVRRFLRILHGINSGRQLACEIGLVGLWGGKTDHADKYLDDSKGAWSELVGRVRSDIEELPATQCGLELSLFDRRWSIDAGYEAICNERILGVLRGRHLDPVDWFTLRHDLENPFEVANARPSLVDFIDRVRSSYPLLREHAEIGHMGRSKEKA